VVPVSREGEGRAVKKKKSHLFTGKRGQSCLERGGGVEEGLGKKTGLGEERGEGKGSS